MCYDPPPVKRNRPDLRAHDVSVPGPTRALLLALAAAALFLPACRRESPAAGPAPTPLSQIPEAERGSFLLKRGIRLLAGGQGSEAVKVLELARHADPASVRIGVELARAYLHVQKLGMARKILKETLASSAATAEEKVRGREVLAEVLLAEGNLEAAKQACAPLLEGGAASAVSRRISGMIAYREGDSERAMTELNEEATLDPGDAATRTALGLALLQAGDLPGAAAALEEAVRLDPGSHSAVSNLAKVYDRQGRDADAAAARQRFQEIEEIRSLRQKVEPLQVKGAEAYNAGRLEEALGSFQEVLKISPRDPEALAYTGSVHIALQKLDEAERFLNQALEVVPEDAFALTEMGRIQALRNDLPGATDFLLRASRSDPDAPEPHYFLAGIYYAQGRKEDFVREKAAFERLRRISPMPGIMELPETPGP